MRYQFTQVPAGRELGLDQEYKQIDGYVQYLLKSHHAKFLVGAFHTEITTAQGPAGEANGIQMGIQLIQEALIGGREWL